MELTKETFEDWCGRAEGQWIPNRTDNDSVGVCKMSPGDGYREVELQESGNGYSLLVREYDQWHSVDDDIEIHRKNIVIEDSYGRRSEIGQNSFPI